MAEMRTRDECVVAGLGWGIHNIHNISTAANCGPGQPGLLPRYILRTIPKRVLIEYMDQFCLSYLSSFLHKRELLFLNTISSAHKNQSTQKSQLIFVAVAVDFTTLHLLPQLCKSATPAPG